MDGVRLQIEGQERPRDVSSADLVIKNHQSIKAEVEARADSFDACVAMGTALLDKGHYAADKVRTPRDPRPPQPHGPMAPRPHSPTAPCLCLSSSSSPSPHPLIWSCPHVPIPSVLIPMGGVLTVSDSSPSLGAQMLRDKFREFSRDTSGIGQERVDAVNAAADALIAAGHTDNATVAEWKDGLNEAWADLLELMDTRSQMLAASYELHRFYHDARETLAQVQEKQKQLPDEVGRDLNTAEAMQRMHSAYEHDIQALSAQVRQVQDDAARLEKAYAGEKAADIRRHERAVS
ncbi:spectrin beta chain, non-erythrocytic 2-like, partial [Numida meleagris]|uniref:spectrin beta chain, non-erythrocytic 2-like n=1 Tax=Numida meleagris TaxID=8996 RepID=UPI000B3DE343